MDEQTRVFVLTFGRSGSSLLCAILADAGGDFGLPVPDTWDPRHGELEHPPSSAPPTTCDAPSTSMPVAATCSFPAEAKPAAARPPRPRPGARGALRQIGDLDLLVQMGFALGYTPRVVLNLRRFEDSLPSTLVGRKHLGPDELAADYMRIGRQGLALMQTFGGCVVTYEDMLAGADGAWVDALAATTGLAADRLRTAVRKRVTAPRRAPLDVPGVYPECASLHAALSALSGRCFTPSVPVARALEARRARAEVTWQRRDGF